MARCGQNGRQQGTGLKRGLEAVFRGDFGGLSAMLEHGTTLVSRGSARLPLCIGCYRSMRWVFFVSTATGRYVEALMPGAPRLLLTTEACLTHTKPTPQRLGDIRFENEKLRPKHPLSLGPTAEHTSFQGNATLEFIEQVLLKHPDDLVERLLQDASPFLLVQLCKGFSAMFQGRFDHSGATTTRQKWIAGRTRS